MKSLFSYLSVITSCEILLVITSYEIRLKRSCRRHRTIYLFCSAHCFYYLFQVQNSIRADHSLVISCTIELLPDAGRIPCRRVEPSALVITDMAEVSRVHMQNGGNLLLIWFPCPCTIAEVLIENCRAGYVHGC